MINQKQISESPLILDDFDLLSLMVNDATKAESIYRPGPYWLSKTKSIFNEIKKFGLHEFRGMNSSVGTSYCDNAYVDMRGTQNYFPRNLLTYFFRNVYPFNKLFDAQVGLTASYFNQSNSYQNILYMNNPRVIELLSKYNIDFHTTRGGCLSFLTYEERNIAHIYLCLLDTLDHVDRNVNLKQKKTCFEIGGGFGVNVHLLVELFNIKKIIYLDVAPNLYVGTQYLKSFYGEKVIDYSKTKDKKAIDFKANNDLEIFCIVPHQIDTIAAEIDFFHNAHSFVEMPENIVSNYAKKVEARMAKTNSAISLVSYDGFDLATTFDPEKLPAFFTKPAEKFSVPTLSPQRSNFHFVI